MLLGDIVWTNVVMRQKGEQKAEFAFSRTNCDSISALCGLQGCTRKAGSSVQQTPNWISRTLTSRSFEGNRQHKALYGGRNELGRKEPDGNVQMIRRALYGSLGARKRAIRLP